MIVVETIAELRQCLSKVGNIGFVPTMGALHDGHKALMIESRKKCDCSVVSVFVNPTQFGPGEDFEKYPRTLEADLEGCKSAEVDIVFLPSKQEMYANSGTTVTVSGVTELYEGSIRPGHFEGVATVVLKLFNIVTPTFAFFGLKDLQQCAVIRKMVTDLNLPVELGFIETVREKDGMALSSRNRYLSQEDRLNAAKFYQTLAKTAQQISSENANIKTCLEQNANELEKYNFHIDYLDLVNPITMQPTETIEKGLRIVGAVKFANVRLIDNVPLFPA